MAIKPTSAGKNIFDDNKEFYYLLLLIQILIISALRWFLVEIPLERDEGEYAYIGKLILNGIQPFSEAYTMKLPGTSYMYAFIMLLFGQTCKGIHLGLLMMNAGTMWLLYYSLKSFFNYRIATFVAGIYGMMALSSHVFGFAAHATHFIIFFLSLGLVFFAKYETKKNPLHAALFGIMLGIAFLMKQQAVYFILFGGITFTIFLFLNKLLVISKKIYHILIFSISVFIPYLVIIIIIYFSGTFEKFWFWTVKYAQQYTGEASLTAGIENFSKKFIPIWEEFVLIWLLAVIGFVLIFTHKFSLKQKVFAILFFAFSFFAITPGLFFRNHYFIVLLPSVAILASIAVDYFITLIFKRTKMKIMSLIIPVIFLFVIFIVTIANNTNYYLTVNPKSVCKNIYHRNPFVEAVEIAKYIKQNSSKSTRIAVLGSEPEILFYADRRSATGYLYMYPLVEIHNYNRMMQEEVIAEIEKNKPEYIIFCDVQPSWLVNSSSPKIIFNWFDKYAKENYMQVGQTKLSYDGQSNYYWGENTLQKTAGEYYIFTLKRKL